MKVKSQVKAGYYAGRNTNVGTLEVGSDTRTGGTYTSATTGCFVAGTRLRLADGREAAVEELDGHELILRPDGTTAPLLDGRAGPELPPVYHFETEHGLELGVTEHHPMVVSRHGQLEVVAAADVRLGDRFLAVLKPGHAPQPSTVTAIVRRPYAGIVYNVRVAGTADEASHFLVANGLVTGDLQLQEQVERTRYAAVA